MGRFGLGFLGEEMVARSLGGQVVTDPLLASIIFHGNALRRVLA